MLEVKNLPSEPEELHQMIFDLVVKNKDLEQHKKNLEQHKKELEEQVKLLKKNKNSTLGCG